MKSLIISGATGAEVLFEEFIDDLAMARVVYIGEHHDQEMHHHNQLRALEALYQRRPDLAVGMEMFDHSYQPLLDQWSEGALSLDQFVKMTHWYANWKFDIELYQDILTFVKDQHIRLIGLNLPFHIPPKIAIGGIDSLLADDKQHLPRAINTSDVGHRRYLQRIFSMHRLKGRDDFENFYAAQCVWEDAMAETLADNLGGGVMAALAGNGHMLHKYGVPDRAYKLTQAPFRTVIQIPTANDLTAADYHWVTA